MIGMSNAERKNLSNSYALRRCRELLKLKRTDIAQSMGLSHKAVEKYENGRVELDDEKIGKILVAMNLTHEEFRKIKKGKSLGIRNLRSEPLKNKDRRSYQKIITKQVKVLKSLRKMVGLSQDQASSVCGYSRPSIGHIENGRIEIDDERVNHILKSYKVDRSRYEDLMNEEVLRDEVISFCNEKIMTLQSGKLLLIQSMLMNI